jgi:hypothetical protein
MDHRGPHVVTFESALSIWEIMFMSLSALILQNSGYSFGFGILGVQVGDEVVLSL